MRLKHPNLETQRVRGEGHAPLLRDWQSLVAIADFLLRAERSALHEQSRRTARG
jgi:hypothetical protein